MSIPLAPQSYENDAESGGWISHAQWGIVTAEEY